MKSTATLILTLSAISTTEVSTQNPKPYTISRDSNNEFCMYASPIPGIAPVNHCSSSMYNMWRRRISEEMPKDLDIPLDPSITLADIAENIERYIKTPSPSQAVRYAIRVERELLAKSWRNSSRAEELVDHEEALAYVEYSPSDDSPERKEIRTAWWTAYAAKLRKAQDATLTTKPATDAATCPVATQK